MKAISKVTSWLLLLMLLLTSFAAPGVFAVDEVNVKAVDVAFDAGAPDETSCASHAPNNLGWFGKGAYAIYDNVQFTNAVSMTLMMKTNKDLTLEVRVDSRDSDPIGEAYYLPTEGTNNDGLYLYTVIFNQQVEDVHSLVLTTDATIESDYYNADVHSIVLNSQLPTTLDGQTWFNASTELDSYTGSIDKQSDHIGSFENAGNKALVYNYVQFNNAVELELEMSSHMSRTLTMEVRLDSRASNPVAEVYQLPRYKVENGKAYFSIRFSEPITGVHHLILTVDKGVDSTTYNEHLYQLKLNQAVDGHVEFDAGKPDATTCTTGDHLGYYGAGRYAVYNNIQFKNAVSLTLKMTGATALSTKVWLDSANGTLISEAVAQQPDYTKDGYNWYTLLFDEPITGVHHLVLTTEADGGYNGDLYKLQLNTAVDGHEWIKAISHDYKNGGNDNLEQEKVEGFENGDNNILFFNNVSFKEAEALIVKTTKDMKRALTLNVYLDSENEKNLIGYAARLKRYKTDDNYAYYTIFFNDKITGVHHLVLTTDNWTGIKDANGDDYNEHFYGFKLSDKASVTVDGHEWIKASDFSECGGNGIELDATLGKVGSFEDEGESLLYQNVELKNAKALLVKTSKHMNRTLTINIYLDSVSEENRLASAVQLERYEEEVTDNSERYAYFSIPLSKAVSGVHGVIITSDNLTGAEGDTHNEHFYGFKFISDSFTVGHVKVADNVYKLAVSKNEATTDKVTLIVAKYDANKKLIGHLKDEFNPETAIGEADTLEVSMTPGEGETVKVFVWDSIEGMVPLKVAQ